MTNIRTRTLPRLTLDVDEIAEGTNTSKSLVYNEIATGQLETCLLGDRRVATPKQIERWLARKAAHARQKRAERKRD